MQLHAPSPWKQFHFPFLRIKNKFDRNVNIITNHKLRNTYNIIIHCILNTDKSDNFFFVYLNEDVQKEKRNQSERKRTTFPQNSKENESYRQQEVEQPVQQKGRAETEAVAVATELWRQETSVQTTVSPAGKNCRLPGTEPTSAIEAAEVEADDHESLHRRYFRLWNRRLFRLFRGLFLCSLLSSLDFNSGTKSIKSRVTTPSQLSTKLFLPITKQ